ncbi:phytoene desaturase family protein [Chromobacterium violaceum]|uniref:phytoene desaturase family protein n=1 Tax=Chromobacterium violaceum TaxID=536 RepID=UPI0009DA10FC|nr:NAD(P)/FAD-dependent oxidoreductase [Chromobacterium violaceum]OQS21749.1 hypothetical protein B0T41_20210 [Chromobacterium violaceum]
MSEAVWDIVCVGSGIAALTYAAALTAQRPGLRVLLLEQHTVPGGYSSEFVRPKQGARFDCSLHKLSGMGEQGNLRQVFRALGLEERINLHFSPVLFQAAGPLWLEVSESPEQALDGLLQAFPGQREGLLRFFDDIAVHGKNGYLQFEMLQGRYEPDFAAMRYARKHLKNITVRDALRRMFDDPQLCELLALPSIYVGSFPEQCSYLYFLHVVYANLYMRSAYMDGGSQRLSNLLVEQIRARGGEVVLNVNVERILVDKSAMRATGVATDRGEFLAREVLVNASPVYALEQLFEPMPELDAPRQLVSRIRPANATSTLYLVLDEDPAQLGLPHAETMLLADDPEDAWRSRERSRADPMSEALAEEAYWQRSSLEITNYHALDASGGKVVIVNALDDPRHWPRRKTPEYRAKKKRGQQALLERVGRHFPDLSDRIVYAELSSPHTYQRYTNNTAGSGYGALVAPDAAPALINHRFPVAGVSFLSAWVAGSGYEAAMGYSMFKASSAVPAAASV